MHDAKSASRGKGYNEISCNEGNQKNLQQGMLNGEPIQMLIDTDCTKTMVSVDYLYADHLSKDRNLCVHGVEVCYSTVKARAKFKVVGASGIQV